MIHTDGIQTIANAEPRAAVSERVDYTSLIHAYEQGVLDEDETLALFQWLVDTGFAWRLQGSYGRTAASLIEAGLIEAR